MNVRSDPAGTGQLVLYWSFDFAFVHAADSVNQRLVYDEGVTLSLDSGRIIIDSRFQDGP